MWIHFNSLVKFGDHQESITIEALSGDNIEKINKFRAAYTGKTLSFSEYFN